MHFFAGFDPPQWCVRMASHPMLRLVLLLFHYQNVVSGLTPYTVLAAKRKEDAAYWNNLASIEIKSTLHLKTNDNIARNVIFFLGDGMSIPTLAAARIYKGQLKGLPGEEGYLHFERFPHVALIKTYNVDRQVPDSAATATAFLRGVKANYETVGLDATARHSDCSTVEGAKVKSVANWAQEAGKSTGVVTTTTITHATPAGAYAYTPNRDWAADIDIPEGSKACKDIARQLIEDEPGRNLNVIFGGGRENFLPENLNKSGGRRTDGADLIQKWIDDKKKLGNAAKYVATDKELRALDTDNVDHALGLFAWHHMEYEYKRRNGNSSQPSLTEMTVRAINILQKNPKGFFLLVEGGRIDHAHHDGYARRALEETLAMEEAVKAALKMVDMRETLVLVTADHAHVMTVNGYPVRGNDILGFADISDMDHLPYTTLMYTNGPGFNYTDMGTRHNLTNVNTSDWSYIPLAAVPATQESHGGDDVAVYALGPMAHLFHGLHEQHYIAHVMAYAACIGQYANACPRPNTPDLRASESPSVTASLYSILFCTLTYFCYFSKYTR